MHGDPISGPYSTATYQVASTIVAVLMMRNGPKILRLPVFYWPKDNPCNLTHCAPGRGASHPIHPTPRISPYLCSSVRSPLSFPVVIREIWATIIYWPIKEEVNLWHLAGNIVLHFPSSWWVAVTSGLVISAACVGLFPSIQLFVLVNCCWQYIIMTY